jgi:hypothetical protein
MADVKLTNGAEYNYGCMLEGARGWRASGALVEIAAGEGMALTCHARRALVLYDAARSVNPEGYDVTDYVHDLAEEAETYLNGLVPEDVSAGFFWEDGEFFFRPYDEDSGEPIWE